MIYDFYSALSQGSRDYQEDAILGTYSDRAEAGFSVVSDGMGGHAAGNVASAVVRDHVSGILQSELSSDRPTEPRIAATLQRAIVEANQAIQDNVLANPKHRSMGATVLATVVFGDRLYWISVGDSPLLLLRQGVLRRLNQDHSLGAQMDLMVKIGQMEAEEASSHPDRHCLTSVLMGESISQIDCPETSTTLLAGDVLISASDGILFLHDDEIVAAVDAAKSVGSDGSSEAVAHSILQTIEGIDDPEQDNTALGILQLC